MSESNQQSGKQQIEPLKYRADLIRGEMAAKEITVEKLAEKAGVAPNTVSAIRNGNPKVGLPSLYAVVTALGLTLREVFEPKPGAEERLTRPTRVSFTPQPRFGLVGSWWGFSTSPVGEAEESDR